MSQPPIAAVLASIAARAESHVSSFGRAGLRWMQRCLWATAQPYATLPERTTCCGGLTIPYRAADFSCTLKRQGPRGPSWQLYVRVPSPLSLLPKQCEPQMGQVKLGRGTITAPPFPAADSACVRSPCKRAVACRCTRGTRSTSSRASRATIRRGGTLPLPPLPSALRARCCLDVARVVHENHVTVFAQPLRFGALLGTQTDGDSTASHYGSSFSGVGAGVSTVGSEFNIDSRAARRALFSLDISMRISMRRSMRSSMTG